MDLVLKSFTLVCNRARTSGVGLSGIMFGPFLL